MDAKSTKAKQIGAELVVMAPAKWHSLPMSQAGSAHERRRDSEEATELVTNSKSNHELLTDLRKFVGRRYVLTGDAATWRYRKGFRFGNGPAFAVVRPGSLIEMWRVLGACHSANKIMIVQAANTGLTGGSTPDDDTYDREIVIISTMRLAKIHLIKGGEQVI